MCRTLFFDLDGTLTDPKVGITRSIQYAHERLNMEVPSMQDLLWCIGPPLQQSLASLVGEASAADALRHYRERFSKVGLFENAPYAHIEVTLRELAKANFRLCVASSKPEVFVRKILNHFDLSAHFTHIFGSELDGTRSDKTELLSTALSEIATPAAQTTMIGDRKHDIIGARNNGIQAIGVLYGYGSAAELRAAGADHIVETHAELLPYFAAQ